MTFTLKGETPAKKNSRITLRNGKTIPGKAYQKWYAAACSKIIVQRAQAHEVLFPVSEPVSILITFCHGDQRRRDSDNGTSSILDLLVDCGVLADDRWQIVREIKVVNTYSKDDAGCTVCLNKWE